MNTSLHTIEQNLIHASPKRGGSGGKDLTRIRRARSFPPNVARMPQKKQHSAVKIKKNSNRATSTNSKEESKTTPIRAAKLSPDFQSSIYDSLRPSVESILSVSTRFQLKSSRSKGVVLVCGDSSDPQAKQEGFGTCIVPLKTMINHGCPLKSSGTLSLVLVDNPLIHTLGTYAANKKEGPELILGLCCNNWGMYYGRNALIEALLEVMGPANHHKLSIHSALYALDFNTHALTQILDQEAMSADEMDSSERLDRALHAAAFAESAAKYGIGLDTIEKDTQRFENANKADFVEELSQAVTSAVERTMANNGKAVLGLVLQILRHRRLIQENLANKKFRRAPSQNGIAEASERLVGLLAENFDDSPNLANAEQIPGWKAYTQSLGGTARAVLGLFCHAIDVLAGCVARQRQQQQSSSTTTKEATPDLAERLILTVLDKDQRLLEYCFNQVYELMPTDSEEEEKVTTTTTTTTKTSQPSRMYLYRRVGDLSLFSIMTCGAVEMGSKL